jgi:PTK7 protein tyrosine kinase 7
MFCLQEGSRMFEFPEHVQDINGTLHFNKVTHGDKGRYSCVATNSQGIINATIEVDVIGKFVLLKAFLYLSWKKINC